jgi:hypothetical protein
MTTDAHLALNTDLLAHDPDIATILHAAGFENKQKPGHWENPHGIALDLVVASHQSNRQSATARAADLVPHLKAVARIGPGLAPALTDNKLQVIGALDPQTPERMRSESPGVPRYWPPRPSGSATVSMRPVAAISSESKTKTHLTSFSYCRPARLPNSARGSRVTKLTPQHTQMLSAARGSFVSAPPRFSTTCPPLPERASRCDPTVAPSFVALVLELLAAVST